MNKTKEHKKELVADIVKEILQWIAVTAVAFLWWMFVLLLISLFLLNIWHTSFESILRYGIGFTTITAVVYAGILIHRRLHG